jgi:hypothetical protein
MTLLRLCYLVDSFDNCTMTLKTDTGIKLDPKEPIQNLGGITGLQQADSRPVSHIGRVKDRSADPHVENREKNLLQPGCKTHPLQP